MAITIFTTPELEVKEGGVVRLEARLDASRNNSDSSNPEKYSFTWVFEDGTPLVLIDPKDKQNGPVVQWDTSGLRSGGYRIVVRVEPRPGESVMMHDPGSTNISIEPRPVSRGDATPVVMRRTEQRFTNDLFLWSLIRQTTEQLSFDNYSEFIDLVLCQGKTTTTPGDNDPWKLEKEKFGGLSGLRFLPYNDTDAYRLLKVATEAFLLANCEVVLEGESSAKLASELSSRGISVPDGANFANYLEKVTGKNSNNFLRTLPYFARIRSKFPELDIDGGLPGRGGTDTELLDRCHQLIRRKLSASCLIELIWSYWHEEAMLVQAMNTISLRFQNVRSAGNGNALAMMELSPLRPLNNLLWGYIQDEQHRLTVLRRVYEYDHHYGLTLQGKAIPQLRPADSRSKFLEALHNLLYLAAIFFKEDDDTTIVADGFPMLNALKDVHLLLSEGAHNQFGDLPATARQEMLMQQWLLARPEFREVLPTRTMVAYPEPWMGQLDAMKNVMGWSDTSVMHFHNLGVFGEQLLLSIRFGDWNSVNDPAQAANWAKYWRPEIQGYIHGYRTVTGIDLTADATDAQQANKRYLQPSVHLQQRLLQQQNQRTAMPSAQPAKAMLRRR